MFSNTCTPTSATMFPQADRLDKVATTVDAVDAGACTASAVAVALDVVDRQGAYYANAAETLGLLVRCDTTPVSWELSQSGAVLAASTSATRAVMLSSLVADLPVVGVFIENDANTVEEMIRTSGLASDTAVRRTQTVAAWADYITDPSKFGNDVDVQMVDVATRVALAAQVAKSALISGNNVVKEERFCENCFLQIPSGLSDCPDC